MLVTNAKKKTQSLSILSMAVSKFILHVSNESIEQFDLLLIDLIN
jgi:hypothetical protein